MLSEKKAQISVIVPVYKVEPYLRSCVDSILAQTFENFELILVDDGSPDNCGAICDEYAAKDKRIVVIHQENGGLSAARNAAIDWVFMNSDSEWITFVDSDDWLLPSYLEIMFDIANETGADLSSCMAEHFSEDSQLQKAVDTVFQRIELEGKEACRRRYIYPELCFSYPHCKLFNRKLFENIRFPVGKIYEDEAIIPIVLYCSYKVVFIRARLYCYRQREGSISTSALIKRFLHHIDAFNGCIQFYEEQADEDIAKLARGYRNVVWANYLAKVRVAKKVSVVPDEYKMSGLRMWYILMIDTVRRGGLRFVFQRLGNMIRRIAKK